MAKFKEVIDKAISDFDDIEAAIEAAGVDVPVGTDTSEYGNKIAEIHQTSYQDGVTEGEANITNIINPALAAHDVAAPTDKSEYKDKIDEVYQNGVTAGEAGARDIDPTWTDWRYFDYYNNRNSMVAKLRYSDTSNGTDFSYMFYNCTSLTEIPKINTSNATTLNSIFVDCSGLTEIPKIDMRNATSTRSVFCGCAFTNAGDIDLRNSTDCNQLFYRCKRLTSVGNLNTQSCMIFTNAFAGCTALTKIESIDTQNATNLNNAFNSCGKLTEIPTIDTSKCTSFSSAFAYSGIIHLPEIDTGNGTNFYSMFSDCKQLVTIEKINLSKATNIRGTFESCSKLENITFEGTIPINSNQTSFFVYSSKLTVESLMSFINALENKGTATYTVGIGATNLKKLTAEQVQIATDKRIKLT